MLCECILKTEAIEQYKIWSQKKPDKFIIIQNDRPLIRKKYNLKTKKINWKVIQGRITNQKSLKDVIEMIESAIEENYSK